MRHAKRWLYLVHRWLGVLLCSVFALWFISGIVMMYVGYPKLTPAERLEHLPPLRGSMPFCVELDNLKDTDAPIHQPAAMLVAAD